MQTLISFEEARAVVLATARRTDAESVPLSSSLGRTLATTVASSDAHPPFDTSAMDGYAVRVGDLAAVPAVLPIAETVHAGAVPSGPLRPGTVVGIMTGAPLPDGADAVVPVEWTTRQHDGRVEIAQAPASGQFIRPAGGALAAGSVVAEAGTVVTPATVGLLAAIGAPRVEVRRRPRVAVIATGDELVAADEPLGPGQIRDSNGPGLAAQVVAAGGEPLGPFRVRDTEAAVASVLDATEQADALVFAGGVSMGDRDLVRSTLEQRGVVWAFWKVRQRPGKPLAFGTLHGRPVLGLPGNPVSAGVCFEVYARPLLAACLGHLSPLPSTEPAILDTPISTAEGLHTFARVTAHRDGKGTLRLRPAGSQDSHVLRSLHDADGLAHLPAAWADAPAGAAVVFQPWAWTR